MPRKLSKPFLGIASAIGLGACLSAPACEQKQPQPSGPRIGIPMPLEKVLEVVNPAKAKAFSGPAGAVSGVVRIKGDAPGALPLPLSNAPPVCKPGVDFYRSTYRQGPGRTLADVLVAVTGYEGYVPSTSEAVAVQIDSDCRFSKRTIGLTFGQRLEVFNKGSRTFVPELMGSGQDAMLIAQPDRDPVGLYAEQPGRYVLRDAAFHFMTAEVYVLKYATFDVTGVDGKFSVGRLPPGEVTVSAFLPALVKPLQKKVTIEAGETLPLEFEFEFDAEQNSKLLEQMRQQQAAP